MNLNEQMHQNIFMDVSVVDTNKLIQLRFPSMLSRQQTDPSIPTCHHFQDTNTRHRHVLPCFKPLLQQEESLRQLKV